MSADEKVSAATELLRGGFRLNLSFLRDRFAGNEAAQFALTTFSTRAHEAIVGLEAVLVKALEPAPAEGPRGRRDAEREVRERLPKALLSDSAGMKL